MNEPFLEKENPATREAPHLETDRRNLGARAHLHGELEVVLVLSGEVEATVGGAIHTLASGTLCIAMPGEVHAYHTRTESRCRLLKLYAAPELLKVRLGSCTVTEEHPFYRELCAELETVFSESAEKRIGYPYAVSAAADRFVMGLFRYLNAFTVTGGEEVDHERNRAFLEEFDRFLKAHYGEAISLASAAGELHYSRYYFSHLFSEITGQTFLEYVTLFRLERAREALLEGKSVLDTALACGFGSVRSFHRAAQKYYGCAPSAIRGRNQRG